MTRSFKIQVRGVLYNYAYAVKCNHAYLIKSEIHVTLSWAQPHVTEQHVIQRHVAITRADVNDKRSFGCLSRKFDLPSAVADRGGDLCGVCPLPCDLDGDGVALCVGSAPQHGLLRAAL